LNSRAEKLAVLLSVIIVLTCPVVSAQGQDDQWQNLKYPKKSVTYLVVTREGHCASGRLSITGTSLTVVRPDKTSLTTTRDDVLRVNGGSLGASEILFSGRSSWADVMSLPHGHSWGARIRVLTTRGSKHAGEIDDIDESSVTLFHSRDKLRLAKGEIGQVYLLTIKPLSPNAEYLNEEFALFDFLDPEFWPYFLGADRVSVLLYDFRLPEDDRRIECQELNQYPF
jgi:hypothetical protein